ncbi:MULTISPECIES: Wzz/FepE/Etk N-terminal domain-containing protein [unclassified Photobacterium]|uniref:Wzz/FepE/Etk N-terminal domain-containing protein n=1 Tax=unclassified Photobacterium TaxID=2628852 RepID=UPI000D157E85|nr:MULTISPECIES: Wzz/FepE/Etk N-terminal domain-containing protein [unclassified Photobacterium]PSV24649.1 hypothetical protein C9J42_17935 [Photobacterium sp. GB-56]PSV58574.1 hypothetical protein C9J43_04265 [Photobacterium sp. GB-3]
MMNNQKNTIREENEGFDLITLLKLLLKNKGVIITSSLIFLIIGVSYSLLAQQWWSSSAQITKVEYSDLRSVRKSLASLNIILDGNQKKIFNNIISEKDLLKDFVLDYNSESNKEYFIRSSDLFEKNLSDKDIGLWAKRIKIEVNKNNDQIYNLTVQSKSKVSSYKILSEYISFISKKVKDNTYNNIESLVNLQLSEVEQSIIKSNEEALIRLNNDKKINEFSIKIAEAAGVKKPLSNFDQDQGVFSIALGTDALKEKMEVLNSIKAETIKTPKEANLMSEKILLSNIKIEKFSNVVRFVNNIKSNDNRDKPLRTIICLFSLIFGLCFGIVIALTKELFIDNEK